MCRHAWLLHVGAGHQTQTLSSFSAEPYPQTKVPDISDTEINLGFFPGLWNLLVLLERRCHFQMKCVVQVH